MEYQKFIPEGWEETKDEMNKSFIQDAFMSGKVLQGYVNECDTNFNLYVNLGNNIKGVIPRNELEGINVDEFGFCNPSICKNKVNKFVQFKIKEIYDESRVILSRKNVQQDALKWAIHELEPGMVVKRNC